MKTFSGATTTAIEAPGQIHRGAVLFDLVSGLYGFWDGEGPIVDNAVTYNGGAQLIEAGQPEQSLSLDAAGLTLTLYENPDAGLSGSVLQTIESETYHQRPLTIYKVILDVDTRAKISFNRLWRGYIDRVEHGFDGTRRYLRAHCESRAIDYTRRGWAVASNAQQQAISANDKGLEFCGVAGTVKVPFGQESPRSLVVDRAPGPVL